MKSARLKLSLNPMHRPVLAYPRLPHYAMPCALMHTLTSLHIIVSSPRPCDLSRRCYRRCFYRHRHRHCDRCHQDTTQQRTQRTLTLSRQCNFRLGPTLRWPFVPSPCLATCPRLQRLGFRSDGFLASPADPTPAVALAMASGKCSAHNRQCSPLWPDSPHIRVYVHDHASKPERIRDTGALAIADPAPPSKLSNEPLKTCAIPRAQPKCRRTVQRLRRHQRYWLRTPPLCHRHTPLSHRIASAMPSPVSLSLLPSLSPSLSLSQRRQCDHHHEGTTWRRTHPTGQRHCAAGGSGGAGNAMWF